MSADDVTRTLASLADLRDRGAISAEEYEAKKADLLGRLWPLPTRSGAGSTLPARYDTQAIPTW